MGVNFIDSTTVRIGLKVFLARSDAVTDQLRRDFMVTDAKLKHLELTERNKKMTRHLNEFKKISRLLIDKQP